MAFESISDNKISELISCPKQVENPQSRAKVVDGAEQFNYHIKSTDGKNTQFQVFTRQNLRKGMDNSFSAGILWIASNGESLTLRRYNGPFHWHPNSIENERLEYVCHIHMATERYIQANKKPEGFAKETKRYTTLAGALHCLVKDCNINGIDTMPDNPSQVKLNL